MKNWVPDKHCRAMVYSQYYYPYIYDRDPYFESKMTSCYNEKYDPEEYKLLHPDSIKLRDGTTVEINSNFSSLRDEGRTIIEHFNNDNWFLILFLIIILIIFLVK
ncbi:hypothetical protein Klosneuvirus_1_60 [Klosneuvirus KNV1]|uniref:Uncharacterized protein n=1 Tax=Klosneuvirus KNV1 TaxID=1977640 RepID=A0A1V0SHL7_9VIRU|nr:hypothetical protein Klosneuvirus_1_60 [Klosneuvirus KNV1]